MRTFGIWIVASVLAMGTWLVPASADAQATVKILAVTSPETRGLKAMAADSPRRPASRSNSLNRAASAISKA